MSKRRGRDKPNGAKRRKRTPRTDWLQIPRDKMMSGVPPLLRRTEVEELLGVSRSWIYVAMRRLGFPRPLKFSDRCVRWRLDDILEWLSTRSLGSGEAPEGTAG